MRNINKREKLIFKRNIKKVLPFLFGSANLQKQFNLRNPLTPLNSNY